jgi:crossover junction endodeoxyribonuclease RuvC
MNDQTYCGIDPGYRTGGVSLLKGDWAEVYDLPVFAEGGLNAHELKNILTDIKIDLLVIEKQGARPGQGVSSSFKIGMGYGMILATVAVLNIKYRVVTPAAWKKSIGVPADKDGARRLAIQQFPQLSEQLKRKKDEHRAEALLMATYGRALQ